MMRTLAGLAFAAIAGTAVAHTQDGSLGDAAASTDYYQVTCSDDGAGRPTSMTAEVQHRGPSGIPVSVLVHRGTAATATVDSVALDAAPSPRVYVNGNDGVYNVFVTKAGGGIVNYTLSFHCLTEPNGGGLHTGTTIVFRQNQ
jgi:hypothetical protein